MTRSTRLGLVALLALPLAAGCSKKEGEGNAPATNAAAPSEKASGGKTYRCVKKDLARCEQATTEGLAAAKAKLAAGSEMEKKMAGLMTVDGFTAMCGKKGEFAEGACAKENVVGVCKGDSSSVFYYGGADGYDATKVAYECSDKQTPESADGKALPKPPPLRMSCNNAKKGTCTEDDYKGKTSLLGFCNENGIDGPAELKMEPCPSSNRVGSCKASPRTFQGTTIEGTRVTYAYNAKAASKEKSVCGIMKNIWE